MPKATHEHTPDRRQVFKQIAVTLGGAMIATATTAFVADPVLVLAKRRDKLTDAVMALDDEDPRATGRWEAVCDIEHQMLALTATTVAGIEAQLAILEDCAAGDLAEQTVAAVKRGIRALITT